MHSGGAISFTFLKPCQSIHRTLIDLNEKQANKSPENTIAPASCTSTVLRGFLTWQLVDNNHCLGAKQLVMSVHKHFC